METKVFTILSAQSSINWKVRKVPGMHSGTIAVKQGSLTLVNDKLEAGKFIIDATSIKIADFTDHATNSQLAGHLASDHFLSSEKFPVATLHVISFLPKTGATYSIESKLTIKGTSEFVSFDAHINISGDKLNASCNLMVDRKKFKMKFHSGNLLKYIENADR